MGKHVIVISEDALIYEDTATLEQLPVFGSLWKKAARVEQVTADQVTAQAGRTELDAIYEMKGRA